MVIHELRRILVVPWELLSWLPQGQVTWSIVSAEVLNFWFKNISCLLGAPQDCDGSRGMESLSISSSSLPIQTIVPPES